MKFSRQEYWSGLPFPTSGDLPDPEIDPASLEAPALASGLFTASATWEASVFTLNSVICGVLQLLIGICQITLASQI